MSKQNQILFSVVFTFSLLQFFVFDMIYTYDGFGFNEKIYMQKGEQKYSWGELLCNLDNYPLMLCGAFAFIKVTNQVPWAKYLGWLLISWLCTGLYYTIFENPFVENVSEGKLVIGTLCVFIGQIVIYHLWPMIKREKIFNL